MINKKYTIGITVSSAVVFGTIVFFASKKSIAFTAIATVAGAACGFLADAYLQTHFKG